MNAALADGAEVADVDVSDDQADPADDSVEEQSAQSDSESAQPDVIANANSKKAPSAAQRKRDEKALEAPKSSEAQKNRSSELAAEALRLYNQSVYKGAAGRYEKALAMGPGSFPSLLGYAKTLIELDRPKEAIEAAEKATRIKKNHPDAYLLLGDANQSLKRMDKSIEAYEKYLSIAPEGRYAGEVKMILRSIAK